MKDTLIIGGHEFHSRFILGSGKYSLEKMPGVIENSGAEIITLALRRANTGGTEIFWIISPKVLLFCPIHQEPAMQKKPYALPDFPHELGCGDFIKIEVIHDSKYLMPDNHETVKATEILAKEGFIVMPYMCPDLITARALVDAGAAAVMPLAAPIGSNKGLVSREFIKMIVNEIDLPVIVDAGIGAPSQACEAMELGVDAVMANTAVATAKTWAQWQSI